MSCSPACLFLSSGVFDPVFFAASFSFSALDIFLPPLWSASVCFYFWGDGRLIQRLALFRGILKEKSALDVWTTIWGISAVDTLPEWSKGVDSSSTSANCVGSNPTGVIWLKLQPATAAGDAVLGHGLDVWVPPGALREELYQSHWISRPTPSSRSRTDVRRPNMHGICTTAYMCHIAPAPTAASKRFLPAVASPCPCCPASTVYSN